MHCHYCNKQFEGNTLNYIHNICVNCNWQLSAEEVKSKDKDCDICSKYDKAWKQYIYGEFRDKYHNIEINDSVKAEMIKDIMNAFNHLKI